MCVCVCAAYFFLVCFIVSYESQKTDCKHHTPNAPTEKKTGPHEEKEKLCVSRGVSSDTYFVCLVARTLCT